MNLDTSVGGARSRTPSEPRSPQSSQSPTPATPMMDKEKEKRRFTGAIKDLPKFAWTATPSTVPSTPMTEVGTDEYESGFEEKREKEKKRRKRRKAEIWVRPFPCESVIRAWLTGTAGDARR